jgi:flavin reductase (DIM6/NTAB) family NADH-FMN oxidoreductase RutF
MRAHSIDRPMIVFDPAEHPAAKAQGMLSQVVAPRPIALVSTIDDDGVVNVAPFSYYMAVTGRPLLVAISMGLRESDAGDKDSYRNAIRSGEFVINVTTDRLRDDLEVAAMEFPPGSSELDALGWTPIPSQRVQPPSIAESPAHLECRIHQIVHLGEQGVHFSGVHLVIAEVVCIALDESVCTPDLRVDQQLLAPVGRMGFPWFTRSTPDSMFQLSRVPYTEYAATGRRPGPIE